MLTWWMPATRARFCMRWLTWRGVNPIARSAPAGAVLLRSSSPAARAARRTAATASAAVAGLVQIPQIRGEARIVEPPAVEPGGELAESRSVDPARVRRGGPRDELGRGAGAVRGRERAGCAAAGGHVLGLTE